MVGEVTVLFIYILKVSQVVNILLFEVTFSLFCKSICRNEHENKEK